MGLLDLFGRRRALSASKPSHATLSPPDSPPGVSVAFLQRGETLLAKGEHQAALEVYREAIDGGLGVPAHLGQAQAYAALGQLDDAADSLEVLLALDASCIDALTLLADIRLQRGELSEALGVLQDAVDAAPERADLHFKLGLALNQSGDSQSAMVAYRTAIRLDPEDPSPHINLGLISMQQLGNADEAEREFRHALALSPRDLAAMSNLGLALQDLGRHDEALGLYEQGLATHPGAVELRWNRGIANLSLGRFAAGWEGYDLRLQRTGGRDTAAFNFPNWKGHSIAEGTLLVLGEQGLGDEIMFASCIPDLRASANRVVLECAPRLAPLFRRSFPWVRIHGVERQADPRWLADYPDIRAKALIGSLPRWLRRSTNEFAAHNGYLCADPERSTRFKQRLGTLGAKRCIGLSWRGGTRTTRGNLRSMSVQDLRLIVSAPDVRFVCLQHDPTDAERAFAREVGMLVWDEIATDLDAAAALIRALDLVISVPNTNAHLAGALGTPLWIMLNSAPEWRWQASGSSSLWYPSARLLRAHRPNDWDGVLAEARSSLAELDEATPLSAGSPSP
jgi:tetratricopeptide (TPR) repeat protein